MKYIGAHVSASGGPENAPVNAREIGATAFALFTRNQKRWTSPPLSEASVEAFKKNCREGGFGPEKILPHDSYLINLGNADPESRVKSLEAFRDEARRVEQLGLKYLNFHPGAHLNRVTPGECLDLIAAALDAVMEEFPGLVPVVENTAGQGSAVGSRFEDLAGIIRRTAAPDRMGVCLDTCHLFAGGYDIRTREGWESVMEEFDRTVGMKYLKGMHLNDAKSAHASRVDRHNSLGKGNIGMEAFRFILEDPRTDGIPLILETPEPEIWPEEIRILKGFAGLE